MFTVITVHQEEGLRGDGLTVKDLVDFCQSKNITHVVITQTLNHPVPVKEIDFWRERGCEVVIVELN